MKLFKLLINCAKMPFTLTSEQNKILQKWVEKQDAIVAKKQGKSYAYYGSTGGGYTYCFTPTGLGTVVAVKNSVTNSQIDLTDYDSW
jgi:hypothetical protein